MSRYHHSTNWGVGSTNPQNVTKSKVKNIAVASVYYTEATKRSDFIYHVSEAFTLLSAKYGPNIYFAICGDFNRLNIKPILNLSPNLSHLISVPTRKTPGRDIRKYNLNPGIFLSSTVYNISTG